jgi:micrococcal nuclease
MKTWLGGLVVMVAACTGSTTASQPLTTANSAGRQIGADGTNAVASNAVVVRAIDGDTIDVKIRGHTERIRLIGVDTPETVKPNTPVQCYGPEASAFTKHLLSAGTQVRLVRDVEARDVYGRLLAYVYRSSDGLFVNLVLAADGYARPLTIPPNDSLEPAFAHAASTAEAAKKGLWGKCSG